MKITGIRCKLCDDKIFSMSTHDFKYCKCGSCFVDGGRQYLRVGFHSPEDFEYVDKEVDDIG